MALGTNHFVKAQLAPAIPQVWGEKVNEFYRRSLKLAPIFTDRSDDVRMGGDTIHIPGTTPFVANTKAPQTQVILQNPALNNVDLVIDQHKEASFLIEDKEAAQYHRSYHLMEAMAKDAGYAVGKSIDDAVATALASLADNTVGVGAAGSEFGTEDGILEGLATLGENEIDVDDVNSLRFIMSPTVFYRSIQALDRFVSKDYADGVNSLGTANFRIMGIPVVVTTAVSGTFGYLVHEDTIHWATSPLGAESEGAMVGSNGIRVQSSYEQPWLGTLTTADTLYGVGVNRQEGAVKFITTV